MIKTVQEAKRITCPMKHKNCISYCCMTWRWILDDKFYKYGKYILTDPKIEIRFGNYHISFKKKATGKREILGLAKGYCGFGGKIEKGEVNG